MLIPHVRLDDPLENLCTAISLLQSHVLASDSAYDAVKMFNHHSMPVVTVEMALKLLMPLLAVQPEEWRDQAGGAKNDCILQVS